MNNIRFRKLLTWATVGLFMVALGYVVRVFMATLKPTEAILLSHQLEIDLNELAPGQLRRVDWEGIDVFILHRTPEQIAWLRSYGPPALSERAIIREVNIHIQNSFRSISPEYLVIGVWKNGSRWS